MLTAGEGLSEEEVEGNHYERIQQLQRLLFQRWAPLKELAMSNCTTVQKRSVLRAVLVDLPHAELLLLVCKQLRLVPEDDPWAVNRDFLIEAFVRSAPNALELFCVVAISSYPLLESGEGIRHSIYLRFMLDGVKDVAACELVHAELLLLV